MSLSNELANIIAELISANYGVKTHVVPDEIEGLVLKPERRVKILDTGTLLGEIRIAYPPIDKIIISKKGNVEILTISVFDLSEIFYSTLDERILTDTSNLAILAKRLRSIDKHATDVIEETLAVSRYLCKSFDIDAKPIISSSLTLQISIRIPKYTIKFFKDKKSVRSYLNEILAYLDEAIKHIQKISNIGKE